jgi:hypothetical protein
MASKITLAAERKTRGLNRLNSAKTIQGNIIIPKVWLIINELYENSGIRRLSFTNSASALVKAVLTEKTTRIIKRKKVNWKPGLCSISTSL